MPDFVHPDLRSHVELVASGVLDTPEDQRVIMGLLDAHHLFRLRFGPEHEVVTEAESHLISEELRPALRAWYRGFGDSMNPAATEFRDYLGSLIGEQLG